MARKKDLHGNVKILFHVQQARPEGRRS